jgi:hypothetical protein
MTRWLPRRTTAVAAFALAFIATAAAHAAGSPASLPPFTPTRTAEIAAAVLLGIAVLHTFLVKQFNALAHRCAPGSVGENVFHFLGEVEVVFGLWAGVLVAIIGLRSGMNQALAYLDQEIDFTEASFVFVIMVMSATRPVIWLAGRAIRAAASLLPLPGRMSFYVAALAIGPLLGSFITEPAAMTVTALLLKNEFYDREPRMSTRFMYATLGLLFVNISIGGTLTHFAAPPVLMVAGPWGWDTGFMLRTFGWKAALAVVSGTALCATVFRKELREPALPANTRADTPASRPPILLVVMHLAFMAATVAFHGHIKFFFPLFLFFIGVCSVTSEYQDRLQIREGLLVGFFLGGLVTLGALQGWWLRPVLGAMAPSTLFFGATGLTAFTDNAAITFLGTQVPHLGDTAKYMLVAGAVSGGGLTVIANAPNPAGFGILRDAFGSDGISPWLLLLGALPFTVLAALAFLLLP